MWWCLLPVVEGFGALVTVLLLRKGIMTTATLTHLIGALLAVSYVTIMAESGAAWRQVWHWREPRTLPFGPQPAGKKRGGAWVHSHSQ